MSKPEDLSYGEGTVGWSAVTDGTLTTVELFDPDDDELLGRGVARRAKGDTRNPDLGVALATARAHEGAAQYFYDIATELGWGQVNLSFTNEEVALIKESLAVLAKLEAK